VEERNLIEQNTVFTQIIKTGEFELTNIQDPLLGIVLPSVPELPRLDFVFRRLFLAEDQYDHSLGNTDRNFFKFVKFIDQVDSTNSSRNCKKHLIFIQETPKNYQENMLFSF
jgi:hypothetical protein